MPSLPRRALLGSLGAGIAAGFAGCLSEPAAPLDDEYEQLFEYLPADFGEDVAVTTVTPDRLEDDERAFHLDVLPSGIEDEDGLEGSPDDIDRFVFLRTLGDEPEPGVIVFTGDVDIVAERTGELHGYDRYESSASHIATRDGIYIAAPSAANLEAAIEAGVDESQQLLTVSDDVRDGLAAFENPGGRQVRTDSGLLSDELGLDDDDIRYHGRAVTAVDTETNRHEFVVGVTDSDLVTEDLESAVRAVVAELPGTQEDLSVQTEDRAVRATYREDFAARKEAQEHDSPSGLRPVRSDREDGPPRLDLDGEYIEIEVTRGDPTPAAELTLEVDDEEYDRDIWLDGQDTIEAGDSIYIRTADIEPDTSLTLRHEYEYGASASGTNILGSLHFAFDFDPDTETVAVEYQDRLSLDGDHLYVTVYGDGQHPQEVDPVASERPWAGQEIEAGATTRIPDVSVGQRIHVGWRSDDVTDTIAHTILDAPGRAGFEYDSETGVLEATLEIAEPRPADAYELWLDDEPADEQWADSTDTVESGATVRTGGVEFGDTAEVVWNDEYTVRRSTITPSVDVEILEGEAGFEHAGGDSLPVESVTAIAGTDGERYEVDIAEHVDGEFTEGDVVRLEEETVRYVELRYEDHPIGGART